ncbi:GNAT family N-acetyltransferase [Photobacterium sp. TY1-4]|uniref:GNAT family N-acetyltransferase n=1 Tax=Photobacterium sp. TY1-4 TaxID=2899122 RepID=UPI0021BF040A|nr:GNAT family N-acetyltransferase [Photobacterium sp. TY1-4]UXI03992.1 N-acetyltransferase [Photobacterium sp. TY1-4]
MTSKVYPLEHDTVHKEYRMEVAPDTFARVTYSQDEQVLHLNYSEVPQSMRGHGLGSMLMEKVLTTIQAEGYQILPVCGFIRNYVAEHPEWHHLLADGHEKGEPKLALESQRSVKR